MPAPSFRQLLREQFSLWKIQRAPRGSIETLMDAELSTFVTIAVDRTNHLIHTLPAGADPLLPQFVVQTASRPEPHRLTFTDIEDACRHAWTTLINDPDDIRIEQNLAGDRFFYSRLTA